MATIGSSPLARGLPPPTYYATRTTRIIPARAGFTGEEECDGVDRRDHPRSRGVYPHCPGRQTDRGGSSPLARGLRMGRSRPRRATRIIPARAGFTAGLEPASRPWWDHPRSRGVYPRGSRTSGAAGGSSPLARGLQMLILLLARYRGIIPARAGFTFTTFYPSPTPQDHPRSRGVYG